MKLILSLLLFLFFMSNATGQTDIDELKPDVIKKNRIYKCLKYDYKDSVAFFKKCKNGYYVLFGSNGKKIEKNFYTEFTLKDSIPVNKETKVVYLYDKQGRNFLWLWDSEFSTPRIGRIHTQKYDSTGKDIGYCEIENGSGERCDTYDNDVTRDSVVITKGKKKQVITMGFNGENRKDTSYTFHHCYTGGQLDSIVIFNYQYGEVSSRSVQQFFYHSGILSTSEYNLYFGSEIFEKSAIRYFENGLLKQVDIEWYNYTKKKSEPQITKSNWKFSYSYWSKK